MDGFTVKRVVEKDGFLGLRAEHTHARTGTSGQPKRAYYVEGDNYQMGFLLGLLAREEISRMTNEFLQNVIFSFFESHGGPERSISPSLLGLVVHAAEGVARKLLPDIPAEYLEEIQGIIEGCQEAGGAPPTRDQLITLNFGIDAVLAHVYSGRFSPAKGSGRRCCARRSGATPSSSPAPRRAAHACSAGTSCSRPRTCSRRQPVSSCTGRLLGRAGNARRLSARRLRGSIGSITGLNAAGVAMGVNMLPSRFCSPSRPGFNSLPLVRDCIQYCGSAPRAVERITEAQRGVSWLYPVADAEGKGFIVEAGRKLNPGERFPYFTWVPWHYRRRLPSLGFIRRMRRKHGTPRPVKGVVTRSTGYRLPEEYITRWDERLWRAFDGDWFVRIVDFLGDLVGTIIDLAKGRVGSLWSLLNKDVKSLHENADFASVDLAERGYINRTWREKNCPGPFYFAPQRESRPDVLVATNHAISPEIRLTSMNEWTALLTGGEVNEIQWRYDELTREILDAIDAAPSGITEEAAWDLITFLRPDGRFPDFYGPEGQSPRTGEGVQVHGSVSLCELKGTTMKSLYGYYGDEPVMVHLRNYLETPES